MMMSYAVPFNVCPQFGDHVIILIYFQEDTTGMGVWLGKQGMFTDFVLEFFENLVL
jgi:hypothetical protein